MEADSTNLLDQFTRVIAVRSDDGEARSYQIAGVGARCLAGAIDLLAQIIIFMGFAWLAGHFKPELFPRESWIWAIPVAFIEWHIIYMMLFESITRGSSPGKRLMGIRVVSIAGASPTPVAMVVRNVLRLVEILMGVYSAAFIMISKSPARQRFGDRFSRTTIIYRTPLSAQLRLAEVPESLYSTSEDGYLLQAWIQREKRFDSDSQMASAIDLAAYLHGKYDGSTGDLPDAPTYLRQLYAQEKQHPDHGAADTETAV